MLGQVPSQYFIVKLPSDPRSAALGRSSRLSAAAVAWSSRDYGRGTLIARLTDSPASRAVSAAAIAVEPVHPAFKLHPSIGRAPLPNPNNALSPIYKLHVVEIFDGEETAQVVANQIDGARRRRYRRTSTDDGSTMT